MPHSFTDTEITIRIVPTSARWPDNTLVAWRDLRDCVDAMRHAVKRLDEEVTEVERNPDLSIEGLRRKRAAAGMKCIQEYQNFAPFKKAERSVRDNLEFLEQRMVSLPKPENDATSVIAGAEVRAHIARQSNPLNFVLTNLSDSRVLKAVMGGPAFLSGITDIQLNLVREKARQALHPEQTEMSQLLTAALDDCRKGIAACLRMVLERTDVVIEADGSVHEIHRKLSV